MNVEQQTRNQVSQTTASALAGSDASPPQQRQIMIVSSVPLAAPWNGGDKNLARLLVLHDDSNRFTVHTSLEEQWPESRAQPVRSPHASATPTARQKIDELQYMLRYTASVDLIHIVASLAQPTRLTGRSLGGWSRLTGKGIVHTVPSLGKLPLEAHYFFADATMVVSEHSRQRLLNHGVRNVWRVYPPLDVESVKPTVDPTDLARQLDLGLRAVLYPAHYGEDSGIAEMIQAFSMLPSSVADSVLVLACRSHPWQDPFHEEKKVRALASACGIENRVRVVGNVAAMHSLISACAVTGLVPTRLGSKMDLPLVILESLALQRPVIVVDVPPMSEAVFGAGLAVKSKDIQGLTEALLSLLEDPDRRVDLGRLGKAEVARHCAPNRIVQQYQDIYSSAMRGAAKLGACRMEPESATRSQES